MDQFKVKLYCLYIVVVIVTVTLIVAWWEL